MYIRLSFIIRLTRYSVAAWVLFTVSFTALQWPSVAVNSDLLRVEVRMVN